MTSILSTSDVSNPLLSVSNKAAVSEHEAAKAFETLFLSQMVDEMMKTVDMSASMGAHASEMWRSIISEALAENLMQSGGLGLTDNIYQKLNAYRPQIGENDERS